MCDAPLGSDGVELHPALRNLADDLKTIMPDRVLHCDAGHGNEAQTLGRHHFHQRQILELGQDARADPLLHQPPVQRPPQRRVLRRQQRRGPIQRPRKPALERQRQLLAGAKRDPGLIQGMAVHPTAIGTRSRLVRQHNVQPMPRQLHQQILDLALAADHVNGLRHREHRLENFVRHQLRKRIRNPHIEPQHPHPRSLLHRTHQFPPQTEYLLGVAEHKMPHVRQRVATPLPTEQPLPQRRLEFADLLRNRRLRHVQPGRRARQAAFLRRHIEVTQVVVIEPFHRPTTLLRINRSVHSKRRSCHPHQPHASSRRERRRRRASGDARLRGRVQIQTMIWILFIGTMALSLWAAARVKSVYHRYSQGVVRSGLTGGEVAQRILSRLGIHGVEITHADGLLGDHYDPIHRRLVLSTNNFFGRSPAALGVAAHECGHAIQHAAAYKPLHWRMAAVGITSYASQIVMWLPLLGLLTGLIQPLTGALIMALAWAVIMLFNLVTLPVEFDASRRAKAVLADAGFIAPGEEALGVKRVLDAAAWTYVAAFVTSLAYFLWHLLPLLLGGRSRE